MEHAVKRKFYGRDSYQPQYNHNNQRILIDNATNTECQKPMMLNAWTQTENDDFKLKLQRTLVDDLQDRIRKLEEMFRSQTIQSICINETQSNQSPQHVVTNCINGKTIQNQSVSKSPSKSRQPGKATYKIVAGPSGMEIIEPIEVEYAEEDGTYLDHDLNNSSDSNRLEICIPKEEYPNDEQQQNIEQVSQHQANSIEAYSIQEYSHHQQPIQQPHAIQLQTETSNHQHNQNHCQTTVHALHNNQQSQQSSQIYQTQLNDAYNTINHSQQQQQHQQEQQQNSNRNLQYISVVHTNMVASSNSHIQQQQPNVIIATQQQQQQQQQQSSISPLSADSLKSSRQRPKSDVRHYISQENLHNGSAPEISNEVTVPAVSSSFVEYNKKETYIQETQNGRSSGVGSNFLSQQLNDIEVSLGPNNTKIPAAIYESIDWTSVTSSTRKLLITIFDRETLATHTMTGKPSPAFKGRDLPSKHQLNPQAVQDIIYTVSRKCNVAEKEVRTAITTKCADENKMLKQREKKRRSLQESNKENFSKVKLVSN